MCNAILVLGKSFFLPMIILSLVHPIFLVLFSLPHQPQTNLHLLKIRICYNYRCKRQIMRVHLKSTPPL